MMFRKNEIVKSRDRWKCKAQARGYEVRRCSKALKRHKIKINLLKHLLQVHGIDVDGKKQHSAEIAMPANLLPSLDMNLSDLNSIRILSVNLFINSVISFRSIPRVIEQFNVNTPLTVDWLPHFTSVIHWMLRLGLGLLNQVKKIDDDWLAITDHSIGVGTKKVLVVLRVRIDALFKRGGAVKLEDCECIGLAISDKLMGKQLPQR